MKHTLIAALFIASSVVMARPDYFNMREHPVFIGSPRDSLVVFSQKTDQADSKYLMYRPLVVPLTQTGNLQWFQGSDWKNQSIEKTDQLVVEQHLFTTKKLRPIKLVGCWPSQGIELKGAGGGKVMIASCDKEVLSKVPASPAKVGYDLEKASLESSKYEYKFKKENNMLFSSVKSKTENGALSDIASDADLLIRADMKKFFSMQFDSSDIVSKMKNTRSDGIAAFGTLGFYLNVLFFKVSLDLDTDARFYEDSAHIPMVLTVPPRAEDRLHLKSGILYHFKLADGLTSSQVHMPTFNPESILKPVLEYCSEEICDFSISFEKMLDKKNRKFALNFKMSKKQVEDGMYPQFVSDVAKFKDVMNWNLTKSQLETPRVGLYFEVSKLKSGEHPWDFWLDLE